MKEWRPEEIKRLRLRLRLSQKAFASELGVSREYVNYLERGVRTPSKTLRLLLDCVEKEFKEKGE